MSDLAGIRVAVLFGGKSAEHDVSVQSGLLAVESLARSFNVLPVHLKRDGLWSFPEDGFSNQEPTKAAQSLLRPETPAVSAGDGLNALLKWGTSVVFLALHGPFGEDGRMQGFLELAGLPYTGSGVLGSAVAMNKDLARRLFAESGLPVAPARTVDQKQLGLHPGLLDQVADAIGLPIVIKPVELGSSVGMSICRSRAELPELVRRALEHGETVLLESYVKGQDLTCGVLELGPERHCIALPPTLIRPRTAEFFDYTAKYQAGASEEITPAPLPEDLLHQVQTLALQAHQLLQLRGYSRTDFMEQDGHLFLLETNTLPGLTKTSLLPQAAAVAGITFDQLLVHLVQSALRSPSRLNPDELTGCLSPSFNESSPSRSQLH